ncbi:MAG: response regulator [Bacteroidia bacterium]|nr:response regulator [Bacteroidia bacterium]
MENMEKEGVIIFGGSAGSIEVIMNIFPFIPPDYPFAIVVVLHRKNTVEHHLEDVLSRKAKIPVMEIQDKMQLKPAHIYIAPGDYHLLVDDNGFCTLDYSEKINYSRPSIDVTFDCFANAFGNRCIGILLSGANADGAESLKKIQDKGGLTIVQSPESAKVATMPMSAINLFSPDVIADIPQISGMLVEASRYSISHYIKQIKHGDDLNDSLPTVLIVDDLEDNLFSLNAVLKFEGYIIHKANSGALAIEMALNQQYDCIVLDVQMPEMDGFEVATILGQNDFTKNIPIIFLSALGSDKEKVLQGMDSGAIDFLAKPVDPPLIKAKLKLCIKLSSKYKDSKRVISAIKEEHSSLKEVNSDFSASLRYAQNIQQAILPTAEVINSLFNDNFVIFRPKESIGGDFYYVKEVGNEIIFICGDCTGHGVPGAMMSMISANIIHNIIDSKKIIVPNVILNAMVREFRKAFRNEFSNITIQDGLEVAICTYYKKEKKMQYAGAGRPIIIANQDGIKTIKSSSYGISGNVSENYEFELNEFAVEEGHQIYLYSDGIVDQFGGPKNKKFMTKRLVQLISSCSNLPMADQKEIIDNAILNWKSAYEQIDDILVMGIKF